jgi:hypothetical protein
VKVFLQIFFKALSETISSRLTSTKATENISKSFDLSLKCMGKPEDSRIKVIY